ncbi:DsrE/DsrF-like family protein [bacterium BMS3Abin01]|nr:DsrE/DsrF-like family protein [bacterium BMS3Abin01]HEW79261.1 hypothetical protein [Phycisphaerales bacterium]
MEENGKAVLIINEGPGNMKSLNGLRLAAGLIGADLEVEVFLLDSGVYLGKTGQNMPQGMTELDGASKLSELMKLGANVSACGTCLEMMGVKSEELLEGISVSSVAVLGELIKESDKVLVF